MTRRDANSKIGISGSVRSGDGYAPGGASPLRLLIFFWESWDLTAAVRAVREKRRGGGWVRSVGQVEDMVNMSFSICEGGRGLSGRRGGKRRRGSVMLKPSRAPSGSAEGLVRDRS